MQFDLPKEKTSIIKVIGVGGGGSNAVNYMYHQGITGVNFVVCNTDAQALELSPVPNKIQLGPSLTEGRGAGSKPDIGRRAMEESLDDIEKVLEVNTKMVFITAGMGGGTGTGGAPILAAKCREMGILTVGIVTMPFTIEGNSRKGHAQKGIEELRNNVDTLIVISNDKLREVFGNLKISEAFGQADNILTTAARGIAEIITVPGYVNVDFEDVKTVMTDSGVAIMGSASAEGEHRALKAVEAALSSPLLNDSDIAGAKHILMNITSGSDEVEMDEMAQILEFVQEQAGEGTDVIWGNCRDESLENKLTVTIIATGFETNQIEKKQERKNQTKVVYDLDNNINDDTNAPTSEDDIEPEHSYEPTLVDSASSQQEEEAQPVTFSFSEEEKQDEEPTIFNLEEERESEKVQEVNEEEQAPTHDNSTLNFSVYRNEAKTSHPESQAMEPKAQMQPETPQPKMENNVGQERIERLRRFNYPLKNRTIEEMEDVPAYKRRGLNLDNVAHSSEHNLSRFSLSDRSDEESNRLELRDNNSFLHDSVD